MQSVARPVPTVKISGPKPAPHCPNCTSVLHLAQRLPADTGRVLSFCAIQPSRKQRMFLAVTRTRVSPRESADCYPPPRKSSCSQTKIHSRINTTRTHRRYPRIMTLCCTAGSRQRSSGQRYSPQVYEAFPERPRGYYISSYLFVYFHLWFYLFLFFYLIITVQ